MAWQSEAEKALPPRIVHRIGSFNYTVCGRIWTPGTNPAGGCYGRISGTRDLAKIYDVLTTCPQCLRVMDERGDPLTKDQQGILHETS